MENSDLDDTVYESGSREEIDFAAIKIATRQSIEAIGEDPEREGLQKTPERVAKMYAELFSGYHIDPVSMINGAIFEVKYDEMVLVRDIEFHSSCEHHMLPFMGRVHVAYIPNGKILGLSKIPRIVDMYARRLQVQERMTSQIADFLRDLLQPRGIAVVVEAIHLCSMMRGVKKYNASMTTSAMYGAFKDNHAARQEFMNTIARGASALKF